MYPKIEALTLILIYVFVSASVVLCTLFCLRVSGTGYTEMSSVLEPLQFASTICLRVQNVY